MTNLSNVEIRALIGRYESELRKLAYQASKVRETISELKGYLEGTDTQNDLSVLNDFSTPKSNLQELLRNNPETDLEETGGGYRLSEWDHFVLNSLREANMTLVNSDFFKLAAQKSSREGKELSERQLRGKINRSIHKLTHKRGILRKVNFEGKGYAYALNAWFNENGKLHNKFLRKNFPS